MLEWTHKWGAKDASCRLPQYPSLEEVGLSSAPLSVRVSVCVCACVLSPVGLFATPWTAACQAPLSMEFFRQEYWSGLPGDLPDPEIEPASLASPGRFFTTVPWLFLMTTFQRIEYGKKKKLVTLLWKNLAAITVIKRSRWKSGPLPRATVLIEIRARGWEGDSFMAPWCNSFVLFLLSLALKQIESPSL